MSGTVAISLSLAALKAERERMKEIICERHGVHGQVQPSVELFSVLPRDLQEQLIFNWYKL